MNVSAFDNYPLLQYLDVNSNYLRGNLLQPALSHANRFVVSTRRR
jgi:hypothetical protein